MGWRYLQMLLLFGQQLEDGSSDIQRIIKQGEFYRIGIYSRVESLACYII